MGSGKSAGPAQPPAAPAVPEPRPAVGESLPARARTFGRRHLGVLALVLLIGLAAAGWAVLRARPVADASPLALSTTAEPTFSPASAMEQGAVPATPSTPPTASPAATILVHVVGAVHKPGVVTLSEHARVMDAIRAAGGLTRDARPGELNLAQVVRDAQQVVIGTSRHPGGEVRDTGTVSGSSSGGEAGTDSESGGSAVGIVDLNSATVADLDTLPGVGPVTAQRILAWRTEHGRFSRVEELQEVDGIGPKTYAQLAPHVRV